ncbi:MAG: D-tyrosyl-tRNA(Tyr) deacylase [Planctomycetes bacterium]|nr:D-tyrosyl-tRNA(Tyr) deacylase [Planctomycetota bacterium]
MRLVVQRVSRASVEVGGDVKARIGPGMAILLGVEKGDTEEDAERLAGKLARYRFFPDGEGRMNRSILESGGAALVVSQVTLARQPAKGLRPSFDSAAPPAEAERLYRHFAGALAAQGVREVALGVFGAVMEVEIVNSGPVTFVLSSRREEGDET